MITCAFFPLIFGLVFGQKLQKRDGRIFCELIQFPPFSRGENPVFYLKWPLNVTNETGGEREREKFYLQLAMQYILCYIPYWWGVETSMLLNGKKYLYQKGLCAISTVCTLTGTIRIGIDCSSKNLQKQNGLDRD